VSFTHRNITLPFVLRWHRPLLYFCPFSLAGWPFSLRIPSGPSFLREILPRDHCFSLVYGAALFPRRWSPNGDGYRSSSPPFFLPLFFSPLPLSSFWAATLRLSAFLDAGDTFFQFFQSAPTSLSCCIPFPRVYSPKVTLQCINKEFLFGPKLRTEPRYLLSALRLTLNFRRSLSHLDPKNSVSHVSVLFLLHFH